MADQDCGDELQGRRTAGLAVSARKEPRGKYCCIRSASTEEDDAGECASECTCRLVKTYRSGCEGRARMGDEGGVPKTYDY